MYLFLGWVTPPQHAALLNGLVSTNFCQRAGLYDFSMNRVGKYLIPAGIWISN